MEEKEKKDNKVNFSGAKYAWIIGALVLIVAGWFGVKAMLSSLGEYKITLINAPKEVEEGSIASFTWNIDGPPTTINQTVVHFGLKSTPGELGKDVKPSDTNYTDFVKDFVSGNYGIPLRFIGNAKMDKQGKYYYRIYAPIKGKNYWSEEYTFKVVPAKNKIIIIQAPTEAVAGGSATFTWDVLGPKTTVKETAVYYGTVSNPGELGPDVKPKDTKYTDRIEDFTVSKTGYKIPYRFIGNADIASPGA